MSVHLDSPYQISKCCSECCHTTDGHQCVSHRCLHIRDMKKIHKAILKEKNIHTQGEYRLQTKENSKQEHMQSCHEKNTHPCFVFEQPVPLVCEKIWRDLFPHQTHTLAKSSVILMLAYHCPKSQQAGNATPVCDAIAEEFCCHSLDKTHIFSFVLQI